MKEGTDEFAREAADALFSGRDELLEQKKSENRALIMSKMMQNKPRALKEEKQRTFAKDLIELRNFS